MIFPHALSRSAFDPHSDLTYHTPSEEEQISARIQTYRDLHRKHRIKRIYVSYLRLITRVQKFIAVHTNSIGHGQYGKNLHDALPTMHERKTKPAPQYKETRDT